MNRFSLFLSPSGPRSIVDPIGVDRSRRVDGQGVRGPGFDEILAGEIGGSVNLSAEAKDALRTHGIELSGVDLEQIGQAMDRIARKGGQRSLLLSERGAFVADIAKRTVVEAMPREGLRDEVVTGIDSAALIEPA